MMVKVTSDALADPQDSYAFYEKQPPGLGGYFRGCIEQDILDLQKTAGIHRKIRGYHHVNSRVFQSIFYYRMEPDTAVIMAILDGRMDPSERNRILDDRF